MISWRSFTMDDDAMAVDSDVPKTPPSSHFGQSLTSYSSFHSVGRRPVLPLPQHQLETFNNRMDQFSRMSQWEDFYVRAEDDASKLRALFSMVLVLLINGLMSTSLESNTIASPSPKQADELMRNLEDEEFEKWKRDFQTGLNSGDWSELAYHRTS